MNRLHETSSRPLQFLRVDQDKECNMECSGAPRKALCASDGRTFRSRCEFLRAKCRDPQLEVNRGPCKGRGMSHASALPNISLGGWGGVLDVGGFKSFLHDWVFECWGDEWGRRLHTDRVTSVICPSVIYLWKLVFFKQNHATVCRCVCSCLSVSKIPLNRFEWFIYNSMFVFSSV